MEPVIYEALLHHFSRTLSRADAANQVWHLLNAAAGSVPTNQLAQQQIQTLLRNLPNLTEENLRHLGHQGSICPICFTPLLTILEEEERALAMESPAHPVEELGVTQLKDTCHHIFCRKDISKWVREGHDSCPMCRRSLTTTPGSNRLGQGLSEPAGAPQDSSLILLQRLANLLEANQQPGMPTHTRNQGDGTQPYEEREEYVGMYS